MFPELPVFCQRLRLEIVGVSSSLEAGMVCLRLPSLRDHHRRQQRGPHRRYSGGCLYLYPVMWMCPYTHCNMGPHIEVPILIRNSYGYGPFVSFPYFGKSSVEGARKRAWLEELETMIAA